ncbi:MAG: hypothetical protein LBB61_10790 [Treponema sp.]|jgi:hypothetical protein|nr:hypothetical protein [Treponema sp.]
MKKFALVLFVLAISAGSVFADHPSGWGIGLQGGWTGGGGGGLTIKAPQLPVYWTVNASTGWLGVSGDYYFIDNTLVSGANLGWYLGVGGFANIAYNSWFGLGVEVPIGLSWQPLNFLELYIQAVPNVGIGIYSGGLDLWPNFFGASLGIRFWF